MLSLAVLMTAGTAMFQWSEAHVMLQIPLACHKKSSVFPFGPERGRFLL